VLAIREFRRLKQEIIQVATNHIQDSRVNLLEEGGLIWFGCNTAQTRSDSNFGVKFFFFGKLTYVLKEEDTNIIRGIPQIYNDNRNIKQQMATG